MSRSHSTRLAWGLWAVAMLLVPCGPVLQSIARPESILFSIGFVAIQLCAATVGAIIASRLPYNAVGWIFLAMGAGLGVTTSLSGYGELGINTDSGPLPGDEIAAWLGEWVFVVVLFGATVLLLLLFPTGRFVTLRWKRIGLGCFAVLVLAALCDALAPGPLEGYSSIENPMGTHGRLADVVVVMQTILGVAALPVFGLPAAGLIVRMRRSRGVERQQLKWFAYAAVVAGVGLALSAAGPASWGDDVFLLALLALTAIPLAAGMAIMRYRLYDIDVVINRTLVYGTLTLALAGVYLAMVLLFGLLLAPLTQGSGLAVAGSTLAVAALFRPARGRIQGLVDRRFYRRRYDAARTLHAFGARLRDEVDLDALGSELCGVVARTMQPAHVSLWLRQTDEAR